MKTSRLTRIALGLFVLSLLSCARRQNPVAPNSQTITGNVVLIGYLVDKNSQFQGNRFVGDADGIRVELVYGTTVVATTTTENGIYRFTGIGSGGYVARTSVVGDVADETETLTIADFDIGVTDTLKLIARGDLRPVPNPMAPDTRVYFAIGESTEAVVRVLDLGCNPVRTLSNRAYTPGLWSVLWDGRNESAQPAAGDIFWVTLTAGTDTRAHLLFR